MALFTLRHSWNFPSNNYGQIFGIADSGVETFKGTPIKSLALRNDECLRLPDGAGVPGPVHGTVPAVRIHQGRL